MRGVEVLQVRLPTQLHGTAGPLGLHQAQAFAQQDVGQPMARCAAAMTTRPMLGSG